MTGRIGRSSSAAGVYEAEEGRAAFELTVGMLSILSFASISSAFKNPYTFVTV
jgi:hypothetical protein